MMIYSGKLGEDVMTVHKLSLEQLQPIEALQRKVYGALDDPSILQPLSREELENILNGNGIMIGAFVADRLIAFRALLIPQPDEEEHLGVDIGAEDLTKVIYQEISNVDPEYRGHGLQKTLGTIIMDQIDPAKFDYICATVKPFNIASLKDKFSQGMVITALKYKYGGKLRYVFAKYLKEPKQFTSESVTVPMDNIELQQQLLKEGFFGVSMIQLADEWHVRYQK